MTEDSQKSARVLPEARVEEIWRRIEARRSAPRWRIEARRLARRYRMVVPALAAVGALAIAAGLAWSGRPAPAPQAASAPAVVTPAREASAAFEPLEVARDEPSRTVALADGTAITLAPGARVAPGKVAARRLDVLLERGRARFDVRPQRDRTFEVVAGPVRVEVVGTLFSVTRDGVDVAVEVEHGRVRVLAGKGMEAVELGAGESWLSSEVSAEAAEAAEPQEAEEAAEAPVQASPRVPPVEAWREPARSGDFRAAYAELGDAGFARAVRQAGDAVTLLELADVARGAGKPAEAARPLERLLVRHRNDRRAPLAALTLGRLRLDVLATPEQAARAIELALTLGLPDALGEDALAKLVEARARAGDSVRAERRADEYRQRYPGGRWRASVERWSASP